MNLTTGLRRFVLPLTVLSLTICPLAGELRAADAVSRAIDRGIEYLLQQARREPTVHWNEHYREIGQLALETYALIVAGVSVDHPVIRANFDKLASEMRRLDFTYTLSCYVFALDAAIAQIEQDSLMLGPKKAKEFRDNPSIGRAFRGPLHDAVRRLVGLQKPNGGWHYEEKGDNYDVSNTQFAVLALGAGAKRGAPISRDVWMSILSFFLKGQSKDDKRVNDRLTLLDDDERGQPKHRVTVKVVPEDERRAKRRDERGEDKDDGESKSKGRTEGRTHAGSPEIPVVGTEDVPVFAWSWGYTFPKNRLCWNMTCAGLSSLLLCRENLRGRLDLSASEDLNRGVRNGYGWIMANWNPNGRENGYYGLYSLEKVADLGGVKMFGRHDWYEEVSKEIVGAQRSDGGWAGTNKHGENDRVTTSFALLILNRATTIMLASKNPLERIMLSGRRSNVGDQVDRNWVYVPDLDQTLHYPTLLRTIRLRPHRKLIEFFENIVDNYPPEWKGELIPEMATAYREIDNKSARRILERHLGRITGHEYDDFDKYMVWYRRWQRVIEIGTNRDKERIPYLLRYYESTQKSVPLKKSIAWALLQCKATEAVPLFLADLDNDDADVRELAYRSFKAFFIDFPPRFDPRASESVRHDQAQEVRAWYKEHGLPGGSGG